MDDHNIRPMRIWQSFLFTAAPAVLVYAAIWVVAPAISYGLQQPFLVGYLISWGMTEVGFLVAALAAYRLEGNPLHWRTFVQRYRLGRLSGSGGWSMV